MCKKWLYETAPWRILYRSKHLLILQMTLVACITFGNISGAKSEVFDHLHQLTKIQLESYCARVSNYFNEAFEVDVTEDGYPELFVGFLCGKASCEYLCFRNNTDGTYTYGGVLGLKPGFFQISDISHNGFNDIIMFRHYGAGEVTRIRYEAVDDEYVIVENTKVELEEIPQANILSVKKLDW